MVISYDGLCRFEQLITNYTLLICRAEASNYGFSAWSPMLMHGRSYPTIFYTWGYRSVFTFHRRSQCYAKDLSFSAVVHTWQDAVQHLSASTRTLPNLLASESVLTFSNASKLLCDQLLMILQVQLAPDMILQEVIPPTHCPQTFSVRQRIPYLQH